MGAQAVYIDTSLLSQREPFLAPSLLRGFMKSKKWKAKMESDNVQGLRRPWRGSGLVGLCARFKAARDFLESILHKIAADPS